jgi:Na+-transporting NADH:ubiquinone oxidoreductase subunit NqrF
MNADMVKVRLEPLSVELFVPRGAELIGSLAEHGVEFPCGGTGVCGGCSVRVLAGSLAITSRIVRFSAVQKLKADGGLHARPARRRGWCCIASNGWQPKNLVCPSLNI